MRILVLGGTVFLGRRVVESALRAGHAVSMLTRGLTQPHLHPEAEHIVANRDGGLAPLLEREWDAIIDCCGYLPRVVAQSIPLRARRYVYISSVSAYANLSGAPDEDGATLPDVDSEEVMAHYGELKAGCERLVLAREGGIVVRPGLIVGPHDPTGRFTYWPVRLAAGGDALAPGPESAPVQVIDVRDLADWLVDLAAQVGGERIFNAVGDTRSMGDTLRAIRAAVGGGARLAWVEGIEGVEPWNELPLWVGGDPNGIGMMQAPNTRAKAAGLRLRPLAETAVDTLAWALTLDGPPPRQVDGRYQPRTLTREREAEVLAARAADVRYG